jgi:hypothetical protein
MRPFQLKKTYDYDEVFKASQGFFAKDESYTAFKTQQQALLKAIPTWNDVSEGYSGRGIVISAGVSYLERVWPNVVLMLRALNNTLPIELWTKDQIEYDGTLRILQDIQKELKINISLHTLPDYMDIDWNNGSLPAVFKVKALSLLYSSFEEVILLDADSIPVRDPKLLFDLEEAKSGLIQWPVSYVFLQLSIFTNDTRTFGPIQCQRYYMMLMISPQT